MNHLVLLWDMIPLDGMVQPSKIINVILDRQGNLQIFCLVPFIWIQTQRQRMAQAVTAI